MTRPVAGDFAILEAAVAFADHMEDAGLVTAGAEVEEAPSEGKADSDDVSMDDEPFDLGLALEGAAGVAAGPPPSEGKGSGAPSRR